MRLFPKTAMLHMGLVLSFYFIDAPVMAQSPSTASVPAQAVPETVEVRLSRSAPPVELRGRLEAAERIILFPQVQARLLPEAVLFEEGKRYRKGELMFRLDDEQARLQLYASRSGFQRLLASLMPDIRLDYPDALPAVEAWTDRISAEAALPDIPDFENAQLRRFLSAKGVFEQFYAIRSAEARLTHFEIRAPFDGIVAEALVEPGQLVSPQTRLGTLIKPGEFTLTAALSPHRAAGLEPGMEVEMQDQRGNAAGTARLMRINPRVNAATQQVELYFSLSGESLREGQLLTGHFVPEAENGGGLAEIPRSALLRNSQVYLLEGDRIRQLAVEVVNLGYDTVWVRGLEEGDQLLREADIGHPLGGRIIKNGEN
jgi:multidrug efflux pump subunit AcrA (membrane-fusion protein)